MNWLAWRKSISAFSFEIVELCFLPFNCMVEIVSQKMHSASSNKKKHCKMSLKLGAKAEN
jgi:hypothetical protein